MSDSVRVILRGCEDHPPDEPGHFQWLLREYQTQMGSDSRWGKGDSEATTGEVSFPRTQEFPEMQDFQFYLLIFIF